MSFMNESRINYGDRPEHKARSGAGIELGDRGERFTAMLGRNKLRGQGRALNWEKVTK
jgi:hypothetical protein